MRAHLPPNRTALKSIAPAGDGSVVIIPAASAPEGHDVFDDWARKGLDHYGAMKVEAPDYLTGEFISLRGGRR